MKKENVFSFPFSLALSLFLLLFEHTQQAHFYPSIFDVYIYSIQKPMTTIITAILMYMCVFVRHMALAGGSVLLHVSTGGTKPPATLICCASNFLCSMLA